MKRGTLLVISGGSGVGKDTVFNIFFEKAKDFKRLPTYTTRAIRPGEAEGVHYFFISDEEYSKLDSEGKLIDKKDVNGKRYAVPMDKVREAIERGENRTLVITVEGAEVVKKAFPEALTVLIKPPSEDVLVERLQNRGVAMKDIEGKLRDNPTPKNEEMFDLVVVNENGKAEKAAKTILDFVSKQTDTSFSA